VKITLRDRASTGANRSVLHAALAAFASITAICAPAVAMAQTPASASTSSEADAARLEEVVVTQEDA